MKLLLIFFLNILMFFIYSYYKKIMFKDFLIILIVNVYNIYLINKLSINEWLYNLSISYFLILVIIVDYSEYWIPDLTIIGILIIKILYLLLNYYLYNNQVDLSGVIVTVITFIILIIIELIIKKEILGFGDIKLIVVLMIGKSILDFSYLLLFSSFIGLIFYFILYKKKMIPFGPSIVIAYLILLII